jgi:two-component system, cell cycle sensor histidine kinase and response regulator CckA
MNHPEALVVLNVDDTEAGRYATSRILRNAGFHVWEAATGKETLEKARLHPHLVILDVNLPDMNGIEVCRRIKSDPATSHLPVLHLSATFVHANDRAVGLEGGADGYLVQPVDPDELVANVRALLRLKEAEQQLRQSEERFRRIFDELPAPYQSLDPAGCVREVNPAWLALFGYPREEVLGRSLDEFLAPASQAVFRDSFTRFLETGFMHDNEFEMRRRDGQALWMAFNCVSIGDLNKWEDYTHCVLHNMTDRKRAEAEREVLQAQLYQAQKLESVGRLAGGVAHDFNNMLGVILGYARLAQDQLDSRHPLYDILEEIRLAGERSADITHQLLAFARKQVITPQILDLNEAVEGTLNMLRRLIGEDVELVWQPGKHLPAIKFDPSQISQVLTNLCVNARNAIADAGRITITTANTVLDDAYCATRAGFTPGDYVLLSVQDDGMGIDENDLGSIFEPFFTTKDSGKGTGLGLATVYGIVTQNHGLIEVESQPGQGTTFRLYLPPDTSLWEQDAVEGEEETVARGGETILLVEDEPAVLKMTTMMLQRRGYKALPAETPREAIRLAEMHPGSIELLITDVIMPEMNGPDLAKRLSADHPNLRRLFISGHPAEAISQHGVGTNLLCKPFSIAELAAKIQEVLDKDLPSD